MTESKSNKLYWVIGFVGIAIIFILTHFYKTPEAPEIFGIRSEFFLFGLTLLGVAVLHNNTFEVALIGLAAILAIKLIYAPDFSFKEHCQHEWEVIVNLAGLLLGFGILAKIFESSNIPEKLPKILPSGVLGAFSLLCIVFVLSAFLDNIAAAMIGGTIALIVFDKKVHVGYIVALVAASNAGGAGSVMGDTTTTMMWIDGVSAMLVLDAYVAAIPALLIFGIIGSIQQNKYQSIIKSDNAHSPNIQWKNILVVLLILAGAILTNILYDFPALGVWVAILIGAILIKTPWREIPKSIKGTVFLLSLVFAASLMPVDKLPAASPHTALGLGFLSAVFDNIPLTKLALSQGGYDWGILAFAVGFGGSMMWFGSSSGVAISNLLPQTKSVANWLKYGWHTIIAYLVGFAILFYSLGWHEDHHKDNKQKNKEETSQTIKEEQE